jgi:amidase
MPCSDARTTSGTQRPRRAGARAGPRLRLPPGWEPLLELAAFGPIARSIDDLRLSLPVIADSARGAPERPPSRPGYTMRIAWTGDFGGAPLSEDSREVIERLGRDLARSGGCAAARAEPAGFDYDEAWYVSGVCLGAMNSLLQSPFVRGGRRLIGPLLSACRPRDALMQGLAAGVSQRSGRIRDALIRRQRLIDQIERFFDSWDAWLCPVFPGPAFTHRSPRAPIDVDGRRVSMIRANLLHNVIFNMTGHPAVAIPAGRSREGLPIGVQAIGRRRGEMALLDAADAVMIAALGYCRPPCG